MSPRLSDVERSVVLRSVLGIGRALAYLLFFRECATPPHIRVRHTMWLSFTRPGYEASTLCRSVHLIDNVYVVISLSLSVPCPTDMALRPVAVLQALPLATSFCLRESEPTWLPPLISSQLRREQELQTSLWTV